MHPWRTVCWWICLYGGTSIINLAVQCPDGKYFELNQSTEECVRPDFSAVWYHFTCRRRRCR